MMYHSNQAKKFINNEILDNSNKVKDNDISNIIQRFLIELSSVKKGLDNLKITYNDDVSIVSRIDLLKQRRKVEIIVDCISSRNLNNHNVAVEMMKVKGVSLNTVEMLLFSIQKSASGDTFRKLVKLIK